MQCKEFLNLEGGYVINVFQKSIGNILMALICVDNGSDFKIGGQIIQTVKYADDLALMAKKKQCYRA